MWRNWAGDQQCVPASVERPASVEELQSVVSSASARGVEVRATASGHSFTDVVMVRLDRLNRVLEVDTERRLAKVEGGIVIRDLSEALYDAGLALENL